MKSPWSILSLLPYPNWEATLQQKLAKEGLHMHTLNTGPGTRVDRTIYLVANQYLVRQDQLNLAPLWQVHLCNTQPHARLIIVGPESPHDANHLDLSFGTQSSLHDFFQEARPVTDCYHQVELHASRARDYLLAYFSDQPSLNLIQACIAVHRPLNLLEWCLKREEIDAGGYWEQIQQRRSRFEFLLHLWERCQGWMPWVPGREKLLSYTPFLRRCLNLLINPHNSPHMLLALKPELQMWALIQSLKQFKALIHIQTPPHHETAANLTDRRR